ncbi:MerR family transcriptional regulator [Streptomyces sp. H51]|uniref:DNA polymerase III subunit beta family protein n=1 Tax=Streptomyces sp. H51 TaxID=3111770 RepID=UPI002D771DF3|nr:MerR family transcriptional regulator [Streptomyces sp. H51]
MRSIGEMARDSGLSVSALRFYDRAGVLVPARVDPVSGYRWYAPGQLEEARLLARLRRAGMPLADIRLVLAGWSSADTDLVRGLLQAHLRRLEQGLADARGEFSTLRAQLDHRENPMTSSPGTTTVRLTVPAPELAAALDAVRFAAGSDPDLPMLAGVLFDVEGGALSLVATDRYRMAVARAAATGYDGPRVQAVVPLPLVDAMRALVRGEEPVRLAVDGDRVSLESGDRRAAGQCLDHDFPDYRRLVRLPEGRRALVDTAAFREALRTGPVRPSGPRDRDGEPSYDVSVVRVADDGEVTVCQDGDDSEDNVGVNRDFMLDALASGAREKLLLEFSAPTAPIAVRRPDDAHTFSILMPVRLEE